MFQISRDIFGADIPEFDKFLALNETYVDLIELTHESVIEESRNGKQILYNVG
ncbi:MAG: hypothetical protein JRC90_03195 [Deltaproteobacteria bacterium]|nr:hypothetical protein [Deltaproteobacteria bacterium]